jgi:hypothetical protein
MKMEVEAIGLHLSLCLKENCWIQYGGRKASRGIGTRVYMEEAFRHNTTKGCSPTTQELTLIAGGGGLLDRQCK